MKAKNILLTLVIAAVVAVSCNNSKKEQTGSQNNQQVVYEARLQPMNTKVTGMQTTGTARFVIANDTMTVTIDVKNAPPGIQHWQHFHGFANDSMAVVPPDSADKNHDGIIDVVETVPYSGTTMVPFNAMPAKMNVADSTYPTAGADSAYHYEVKIPMDSLNAAFGKAFNGSPLDLDKRVLYIHGVPPGTKLPKTVASIGTVPAYITLPIACGQIKKVNQ